jgi:hypothetical protein
VGSSFLKRPERGGGFGSKEEDDLEVDSKVEGQALQPKLISYHMIVGSVNSTR